MIWKIQLFLKSLFKLGEIINYWWKTVFEKARASSAADYKQSRGAAVASVIDATSVQTDVCFTAERFAMWIEPMGPDNQRREMVKVNRLDLTDDGGDVEDVPTTRTVLKIGSGDAEKSSHTIKLVIGEPVDADEVDDVDEWDVDDELTHSCCQFFDQRRETWGNGKTSRASATSTTSLQDKMDHLRREIVNSLLIGIYID